MQLFSFSPLRPFVSLPYERRATTSMGTLGRAIYSVGFWIRETGQALDRLGCRLQGNYYFQEQCNPAKFLRKLTDEEIAFISQSATNYANLAQVHAAENAKSFDEIEFEKVLRKKFAHRDEEYDSMLGVVREVYSHRDATYLHEERVIDLIVTRRILLCIYLDVDAVVA
ncbi:hypothetical protein B296_00003832 [Ensete ventricosum]|uniref:Uncharacterized protein n=1 Tax=Ensete ventricosum TaxID=4639 RepID=A0A426ZVL4_ENSVE|nr:hypothetical protein B296_00003832 [Ensete ventricosum]